MAITHTDLHELSINNWYLAMDLSMIVHQLSQVKINQHILEHGSYLRDCMPVVKVTEQGEYEIDYGEYDYSNFIYGIRYLKTPEKLKQMEMACDMNAEVCNMFGQSYCNRHVIKSIVRLLEDHHYRAKEITHWYICKCILWMRNDIVEMCTNQSEHDTTEVLIELREIMGEFKEQYPQYTHYLRMMTGILSDLERTHHTGRVGIVI